MSWKSLVTAGLLCVLASPAFAVPDMGLVAGGNDAGNGISTGNHLDAAGNWIWAVAVTPDVGMVPDTSGTPVAAELGLTGSTIGVAVGQGNILSATRTPAGGTGSFDTINPGTAVPAFTAWQTAGNGLLDANSNNRPTGIQSNCASGTCSNESYTLPVALGSDSSVQGSANQVFAALGSVNFTAANTAQKMMNVTVQRPVVDAGNLTTTTTIKVSGAYGAGNTFGRLTQVTGMSGATYTTSNFDTFGGNSYSFTMTAKGGDADLNGTVNIADYIAVSNNYNPSGSGKKWYEGDFDGNGTVNINDYLMVSNAYNQVSYNYNPGPVSPGSGSGGGLSGSSVPEPATISLIGLALLGGLGVIRRKR